MSEREGPLVLLAARMDNRVWLLVHGRLDHGGCVTLLGAMQVVAELAGLDVALDLSGVPAMTPSCAEQMALGAGRLVRAGHALTIWGDSAGTRSLLVAAGQLREPLGAWAPVSPWGLSWN